MYYSKLPSLDDQESRDTSGSLAKESARTSSVPTTQNCKRNKATVKALLEALDILDSDESGEVTEAPHMPSLSKGCNISA